MPPRNHRKQKKARDLKRHFAMRCIQRVGFPIDEVALKKRLVANALTLTRRESNVKTHFLVPKDMLPNGFPREIEAVYDSKRHEFVTVLFGNARTLIEEELNHGTT